MIYLYIYIMSILYNTNIEPDNWAQVHLGHCMVSSQKALEGSRSIRRWKRPGLRDHGIPRITLLVFGRELLLLFLKIPLYILL